MRIYVAGKWQEKPQVRAVQTALIAAGHVITHDWTIAELGHDHIGGPDWVQVYSKWYDPKELEAQARGDLIGVQTADAIVVCAINPHKYSGTLTEMGIALGCGHRVLIIGDNIDSNIFSWLSEVHVYGSVEEVIDALHS